jgi:hypothetical protein
MEPIQFWQEGMLFHNASRYPRRAGAKPVDRLASILRDGLMAPASCADGSVCSDLHITVINSGIPYDSVVFLHRFRPVSWLYTTSGPGRFTVFIDPDFPVLNPGEIERWVVLSQSEVYVRDRVPPERFIGVYVDKSEAAAILREFKGDFERLQIPLCTYEGEVVWHPDSLEESP